MGFDLSLIGVKENIPKVDFREYTGLIQAPPKWGKTTIASMFDKSIVCAVEPGYKAKRLNYVDTSTWVKFVNFIDSLQKYRKEIGDEIQTIAIDTVDRLYPECQQYIVNKYNSNPKTKYRVQSIGEIPHGKGWEMADEEFLKQINRILDMKFTILFLTHNKLKTVTPPNDEPYDIYVPTMPQRCADIVYPLVDYIINGERMVIEKDGRKVTKRIMRIQSNGNSDSGNRIGNMDEVIDFDTEEEAIEKFKEAFRRGIERNILLSGITKSIQEIEKEQEKERKEQLNDYLNSLDNQSNENLSDEELLQQTISEINDIVTELVAQGKRNHVIEVIKQHHTSANYNTIKDVKVAQTVLNELKKLK